VDISRVPPEDDQGPHFAMGKNVRESNRQTGERMVNDEVAWLGNKAKELLVAYETEKPEHTFTTFDDVERIWQDVIRPELPNFRTMQNAWADDATLPADSVWYKNWQVPTTQRW